MSLSVYTRMGDSRNYTFVSRPDNDVVLLEHVAECIGRIESHTGGSREHSMNSELVQDAVLRNLHALAESTTRLSESLKATEPELAWLEIKAFRNQLTFGFLDINLGIVWEVVEQTLPEIDAAIRRMRSRKPSAYVAR